MELQRVLARQKNKSISSSTGAPLPATWTNRHPCSATAQASTAARSSCKTSSQRRTLALVPAAGSSLHLASRLSSDLSLASPVPSTEYFAGQLPRSCRIVTIATNHISAASLTSKPGRPLLQSTGLAAYEGRSHHLDSATFGQHPCMQRA